MKELSDWDKGYRKGYEHGMKNMLMKKFTEEITKYAEELKKKE